MIMASLSIYFDLLQFLLAMFHEFQCVCVTYLLLNLFLRLTSSQANFSAWFILARLSSYESGFHSHKKYAKPEISQEI